MKRNRLAVIMGVTPGERSEDDVPVSDEKTIFFLQEVNKEEVQKKLNEMDPDERVEILTSNRKGEVFNQLDECSLSGDTERGKALFQEYQECLDDEQSETFDDFHEAFWIRSDYLQKLGNRKRVFNEWSNK